MDTYIEVIGHAEVAETVVEQRATLTVTVKASKAEVAFDEATQLRNDVVRALKTAGLGPDEISEGGRATWQPWFRAKKVGQHVSHRILVNCRDTQRLYQAIDALQPLFENARYILNVDMLQPRFEASTEAEAAARTAALHHARVNADTIAREAAVPLGAVAQVEQLGAHTEGSGAYGDYGWAVGAARGIAAGAEDFENLAGATRMRTLRYRMRFLIN